MRHRQTGPSSSSPTYKQDKEVDLFTANRSACVLIRCGDCALHPAKALPLANNEPTFERLTCFAGRAVSCDLCERQREPLWMVAAPNFVAAWHRQRRLKLNVCLSQHINGIQLCDERLLRLVQRLTAQQSKLLLRTRRPSLLTSSYNRSGQSLSAVSVTPQHTQVTGKRKANGTVIFIILTYDTEP